MAEVFARHYAMAPHEDLLNMEGWTSQGTDIIVRENQGAPFDSGGSEHATEHPQGKQTENFVRSAEDLSDDGDKIIRSVIAVKFMQRDTYLNATPEHRFFEAADAGGTIWALIYDGQSVDDNQIVLRDSNGLWGLFDAGPFVADTWYIFDLIWKHNTSGGMTYWRDKSDVANITGRDFHNADGDIRYKVRGQIDAGDPIGPGGIMYCSYVNHFTDAAVASSARCKKYLYRPYNHNGKTAAVVKRNGTTQPGDTLTGGNGWEKVWNVAADSLAAAYTPAVFGEKSGLVACDKDIDKSGPAGKHPLGTVALVATFCFKYTAATKGGNNQDPLMSYGQGNTDLDTFTIASFNVTRGTNLYWWKHLNPGDTGFPTILQFAMLGFTNDSHDFSTVITLSLIECHCTYLVEDRGPPLTQIKMLGTTLLAGLTTLGAKE